MKSPRSISGEGVRSEDGTGPVARSGATDTTLGCTAQQFLAEKLLFLRSRRGTARPPIAVLWASALGSGSLGTRTTRGEGLARSLKRASLVGGLFYNRLFFYLRTTLTAIGTPFIALTVRVRAGSRRQEVGDTNALFEFSWRFSTQSICSPKSEHI